MVELIASGPYNADKLSKIADDVHNRMYFELLLKNFVLAQRSALPFSEFIEQQNKAARNWHFVKISRWPITWKDFTDPYINVLGKCKNYTEVFDLLVIALPDINYVLWEYKKLKTTLDNAENELLIWVATNHSTIRLNHLRNLGIKDNYEDYYKWRKAYLRANKTLDFLYSYRLNHLITDADLAVQLQKENYQLRTEISTLTEKKQANEKRLQSLLKRRQNKIEKHGTPRTETEYNYPIRKYKWWFLKPKKKNS